MVVTKKTLLSGVKPTGLVHLGNYFGAMKQFVDLQSDYHTLIMIADYHAMTNGWEAETLRQNILDIATDYLSIGLDPERVSIFQQSAVSEHTELAWIFGSLTTMPYLMRAHVFKDAKAKNREISVGTFNYPMLMAADILLYDADVVPVGQDQKQHLEITRDLAEKFNRTFGQTFKLPEPLILDKVGTVKGIDGRKMSKSYGNTIPLFAQEEELKKLVMSITTDSKGENEPKNPDECNVFSLHKLIGGENLPELRQRYLDGKIGYRESKELLFNKLNEHLKPLRDRRLALAKEPNRVKELVARGGKQAKAQAELKMTEIKQKVGITL